eukprot:6044956-Heterocapsa_arctica.AAC.1
MTTAAFQTNCRPHLLLQIPSGPCLQHNNVDVPRTMRDTGRRAVVHRVLLTCVRNCGKLCRQ